MKHFRTKMAALAISVGTTGPLLADDLPVRNCTWCHGTSAQGYYNAPRLAGQKVDYLVNQLQAFATHKRDEFLSTKYMWNAAAHLDPLILRNLAAYFSALPPEAAMDGDSELAAEGKIIFENGVPDENIAACQACHGPEAQGVREIPRLGGLSYSYLKRRLEQWSQGQDASGIPMPKVGRSLSPNQIAALASYLSFVRGEIFGEIGRGACSNCIGCTVEANNYRQFRPSASAICEQKQWSSRKERRPREGADDGVDCVAAANSWPTEVSQPWAAPGPSLPHQAPASAQEKTQASQGVDRPAGSPRRPRADRVGSARGTGSAGFARLEYDDDNPALWPVRRRPLAQSSSSLLSRQRPRLRGRQRRRGSRPSRYRGRASSRSNGLLFRIAADLIGLCRRAPAITRC